MKISGFIIISLLLFAGPAIAQKDIVPDTVRGKYAPSGLRIGFDLISGGQAIVKNGIKAITQGEYREIQFSADIDFYRYFLNFEYGLFDRQWTSSDGYYINKGSHYKIGPDVNFLHRDPDGSALFFGLRYAFANFSDESNYRTSSSYWGSGRNTIENNNISADWFEITTGLKVKLTRIIWLGYTARFQFGADNFEGKQLIPHWIPGYGRADETSSWGVDYWLIIKVPFKKK